MNLFVIINIKTFPGLKRKKKVNLDSGDISHATRFEKSKKLSPSKRLRKHHILKPPNVSFL